MGLFQRERRGYSDLEREVVRLQATVQMQERLIVELRAGLESSRKVAESLAARPAPAVAAPASGDPDAALRSLAQQFDVEKEEDRDELRGVTFRERLDEMWFSEPFSRVPPGVTDV